MNERHGGWRSVRARRRARAMEDRLWAQMSRQPVARDIETSFGPTRCYQWASAAPPIVLLHGGLCTSVVWRPIVEALRDHDVHAIDIMGDVGRSEHRVPFTTELDYAVWLDETLDGLGLDGVRLAGHSLGGWVSLNLAAHRPDRLATLAVFDPGGVVALDMRGLSRWGVPTMLGSFLPAPMRRRIARTKRHPMAEDALACRLLLLGTLLHRPGIPTRTLLTDEELRDIGLPVTLVVGEHTEMFDTSAMVNRVSRLVPHSTATVVSGAGHALTLSHVNECVRQLTAARR
jgi:pimeloyl-ACP methyl ester carboxylesterase